MSYMKRHMEKHILELNESWPAILLTVPRQAGKTTMLQKLAEQELYLHYYRDKDAKEIDVLLEADGKLCPLEIKKTAMPDKRLVRTFKIIDKSPLQLGTGAVLCMSDQLSAFDENNLIVPIWMI